MNCSHVEVFSDNAIPLKREQRILTDDMEYGAESLHSIAASAIPPSLPLRSSIDQTHFTQSLFQSATQMHVRGGDRERPTLSSEPHSQTGKNKHTVVTTTDM